MSPALLPGWRKYVQLQQAVLKNQIGHPAPDLVPVSRPPYAPKPDANDPRVVNRVFGVAVPEVILDQPQAVTVIPQEKATWLWSRDNGMKLSCRFIGFHLLSESPVPHRTVGSPPIIVKLHRLCEKLHQHGCWQMQWPKLGAHPILQVQARESHVVCLPHVLVLPMLGPLSTSEAGSQAGKRALRPAAMSKTSPEMSDASSEQRKAARAPTCSGP